MKQAGSIRTRARLWRTSIRLSVAACLGAALVLLGVVLWNNAVS